jgi:hypothetical protein
MAGLVLAFPGFRSIAEALHLPSMDWVDGSAGAWASLVPLAVLAWLLVRVPLRHAQRRSG